MMNGMTRIIIETGDERAVELLRAAIRQAATPEPEPVAALDGTALANWLAEQADDPDLEAAMMQGALDSSPLTAVMAELGRRATSG